MDESSAGCSDSVVKKRRKNDSNEGKERETTTSKRKKVPSPGIIYLSTVPPGYDLQKLRKTFSQYGEIGRMQFTEYGGREPYKHLEEGWIEFKKKRIAKKIALALNNQMIGGKSRNKARKCLWNIKYLHRFKWEHLQERKMYEQHLHEKRMHTELGEVKRYTSHYIKTVRRNERIQEHATGTQDWNRPNAVYIKQTRPKRRMNKIKNVETAAILTNIFTNK